MKKLALAAFMLSAVAQAQVVPAPIGLGLSTESSTPASEQVSSDDRAQPLAAKKGASVPSKNKIYNLARASEGRLGSRLGDDVSYRVTGN